MNGIVAGVIWELLGLVLVAFGLLFALEGALYITGQDPITVYVRNWTWGHWWFALFLGIALIAGISAAVTHFILDGGRYG